ncbi:nucleoside hydrolase [Paraburkholderia phenazinium]|uniref:Inosine-uridine nucleoside N-ribohydrolase n=1 Tax=Paraburkholderia phenazinium TaxID=60549 RepID=A0A1G7RAX1_9BURK|nr:nucleoside hydrolase [Paraburkholderia phenazinium]SDG07951.1 Inosine-uridine nucleoside N-ribohydrolase [Paraburkholderia phenazinium]
MHKVIYDTDPGVDDSMALVFQTRHPDIELIGVTSVFGNATIETTTRNALYLVERFAKPSVVVARGAGKPLRRATPEPIPHIHGHNGLGDIDLPELEDDGRGRLDARLAHRFIIDEIRKHPHAINLVAVGPLTNLALALQEDPEIQHLVKQVIIMGGAFGINGILGNVSPCAEANISADPDAADQVFAAAWKVTAVGLDVTQKAIMTTEYLDRLRQDGGADGQFVWDVSRHYEQFHIESSGVHGIYVHDSSAVAYLVAPELYQIRRGAVRVVVEGLAIGQTIQKPATMGVPAPNWDTLTQQDVCVDVDVEGFLKLYYQTIVGRAA